jgi:cytochrome c oxidase subunit IV
MASTTTPEPTDEPVPTAALDGAAHEYPRDRLYVQVAVILAAITAVEVATYVWEDFFLWGWGGASNAGLVISLLIMMAVKFAMVVWFFMHLKWDKPILNRVFVSSLLLAVAVYVAVMLAFRIFFSGEAPGGLN